MIANTMPPDQLNQISSQFFAQGISGTLAVAAFWIAFYMWRGRESDRKEHKLELAAKDALIMQLYEKRIEDGKTMSTVLQSNDKAMEAFARTLSARTPL